MSRKTSKQSLLKHPNYPFYGAVLLIATSLISLYWGIVGVEATLHSFDWILLGAVGMVSFACGILGTVPTLQKKRQAIAILALVVPLFMNVVGVKSSLDMYGLANPWLIIVPSLALSIISGYFISNSDKIFQNSGKKPEV
jgi:glucose uptake protein GlcU